ncbi:AMP-binding protein [Paraburkholderia elongata]|uniref:AMP-binding protein n=1 Tax=Paraburkholderia elongata TaxID=2675747 RepID=UPI0022A81569|nr:AMP-binding protein [Paraburkholderia elongata]
MGEAVDFDALRTLGGIARCHAHHRPRAVALSVEGRDTDYGTFERHSCQVANTLLEQGISKGQRVAYVGKNNNYFFELLFGATKIGVVLCPIGWRLAAGEMAYMLEDSGAKLLFAGPEVETQMPEVPRLFSRSAKVIALEPGGASSEHFESWRSKGDPIDVDWRPTEENVVLQFHTSGTTGRPTGAMLAHRSILSVRRRVAKAKMNWNTWGLDDVSLAPMSVAHVGGGVWGVVGLFNDAKTIAAREFGPFKVLEFIERDGISKIFMGPAVLRIVVNQPRARQMDFGRLRYIVYGSSPMPLDLLRQYVDVFGCGFCQTYGMTETSGTIRSFTFRREFTIRRGTNACARRAFRCPV